MKDPLHLWWWIIVLIVGVIFLRWDLDKQMARIQSIEAQVQSLTSKL